MVYAQERSVQALYQLLVTDVWHTRMWVAAATSGCTNFQIAYADHVGDGSAKAIQYRRVPRGKLRVIDLPQIIGLKALGHSSHQRLYEELDRLVRENSPYVCEAEPRPAIVYEDGEDQARTQRTLTAEKIRKGASSCWSSQRARYDDGTATLGSLGSRIFKRRWITSIQRPNP